MHEFHRHLLLKGYEFSIGLDGRSLHYVKKQQGQNPLPDSAVNPPKPQPKGTSCCEIIMIILAVLVVIVSQLVIAAVGRDR